MMAITDINRVCRSAEHAELAGECGAAVYDAAIVDAEAEIMYLKQYIADLKELRTHEHQWDSNDYCTLCGADGRA